MKNAVIIMPLGMPWEWSTDYYEQTARILAKTNFVLCVQWDTEISMKDILKQRKIPKLLTRITSSLYIYRPIDWVPFRRFRLTRRMNNFVHKCAIHALVWYFNRRKRISLRIIWVFNPVFSFLPRLLGGGYRVVYDVVDHIRDTPNLRVRDKQLLHVSHLVAVNSRTLRRIYLPDRVDVICVPQGFRLQAFQKYTSLPSSFDLPYGKPIIGYIGGINVRLDYSLLRSLVANSPQYIFVFAGPMQENNHGENEQIISPNTQKLFSYPNCIYLGNISKKFMPALIEKFDICMIPYAAKRPFNTYCFPMKLFEYFYMGKPVISTQIEELKYYSRYVKVGATAEIWKKHIRDLLSRPWPVSYQREQKRLAVKNSWEKKISVMEQFISSDRYVKTKIQ